MDKDTAIELKRQWEKEEVIGIDFLVPLAQASASIAIGTRILNTARKIKLASTVDGTARALTDVAIAVQLTSLICNLIDKIANQTPENLAKGEFDLEIKLSNKE